MAPAGSPATSAKAPGPAATARAPGPRNAVRRFFFYRPSQNESPGRHRARDLLSAQVLTHCPVIIRSLSSSAQADDPVICECLVALRCAVITGCPAFAGHDSWWVIASVSGGSAKKLGAGARKLTQYKKPTQY